jgi:hypothetical protein
MNEHKLASWTYAVLVFFQICVLQTYRGLKPLHTSGGGVCAILWVCTGVALWLLLRGAPRPAQSHVASTRKLILPALLMGALVYAIFVLPRLGDVMSTWGDEDHHISVSESLPAYIGTYFHGQWPQEAATLRYTAATRLFDLPFLMMGGIDADMKVRLGLVFPYLGLVVGATVCAWRLSRSQIFSLLVGTVVALSPLNLSFATDKYLDLGHPAVFLLASFHLVSFLRDPRKADGSAWLCALYAGILPLVRENAIPTTLLYVATISVVLLIQRRIQLTLRCGVVAVAPFAVYYLAKISAGASSIDTTRLSFSYVSQQDYGLFFQWLPFYLPIEFAGLVLLVVLISRTDFLKEYRAGVVIVLASFFAQLLIYAVFEPGWMPWTRNYLMFSGQLLFLAVLAFSVFMRAVPARGLVAHSTLAIGAICLLALDLKELPRLGRFHENELKYDYRELREIIERTSSTPGERVYFQIPIIVPASLLRYFRGASFVAEPVLFDGQRADRRNFMSWSDFAQRVPHEAKTAVFHYRSSTVLPQAIREHPQQSRPTPQQISEAGWKTIADIPVALADGKSGMLLLRR